MGKTRFGRRLSSLGGRLSPSSLGRGVRSPTNKNKAISLDAESGDKSCCSVESSTSSLDSNIRDHGPIDTDTDREFRPKAKVDKPRVQSPLPRISESNANSSRAGTPNIEDESVAKSSVTSGRTSPFISSLTSGLGLGPNPNVLGRIHNWLGPSPDERGDSLTKDGTADSRVSVTDIDISFVDKEDKYRVDTDCPEQGNGGDKYRRDIDRPDQSNGKDKYKVICPEQGENSVIDRHPAEDARPAPEDDKYTLSPSTQMFNKALQTIERATSPIADTIKSNFDFAGGDDGDSTFKALKKGAKRGEFDRVVVAKARSPVGRPKSPTGRPRSPLAESRHDETTRSSSPAHKQSPRDQAAPDPPGRSLDAETPLTGNNAPWQQRLSTASPITLESSNDANMQLEIDLDSFDDDNMLNANASSWETWHSGDESITYSICDETQRLIDQSRDFEAKKGSLRAKGILKTSIISGGGGSQIRVDRTASDCSVVTEVVGGVAGLPGGASSVKTEKRQRKSLTWYDDKVNENKPFLLRTDESFETVWSESTQRTMGTQSTYNTHMTLLHHVSEFIGRIEIAQCGANDHAYDIHEQSEI